MKPSNYSIIGQLRQRHRQCFAAFRHDPYLVDLVVNPPPWQDGHGLMISFVRELDRIGQ